MVLGGPVATTEPKVYATWVQTASGDIPYTEAQKNRLTSTAGAADVDVIEEAPADYAVKACLVNIFNADSASVVATLKIDESGTETILWKGSIEPNRSQSFFFGGPEIPGSSLPYSIVLEDDEYIEVVLSSAHTTTAPKVFASYTTSKRERYISKASRERLQLAHSVVTTNGTTHVTLVGATGEASYIRRVDAIFVHNNDTALAGVSIRINKAGTRYTIARFKLQPGENAWFTPSTGFVTPEGISGSGAGSDTVVSETSFGQSSSAGSSSNYSRADHTHGTPTNPVPAHEAAADPHPGYQLESEKGAVNGYASLSASAIVPASQLATSGTADGTTFLRGDRVWATPPGGGGGGSTDDAIWARLMGVF